MSKRIEETSDGLKIRDTETGNLAGSVSTVGKKAPTASPKTLDSQATLAESIEPSSVESSYQTYQEAKESTTEERRVCPNCEGAGWTMEADPRDPSGQTPMQEQCNCDSGYIPLAVEPEVIIPLKLIPVLKSMLLTFGATIRGILMLMSLLLPFSIKPTKKIRLTESIITFRTRTPALGMDITQRSKN